jgi:hypothetical protein
VEKNMLESLRDRLERIREEKERLQRIQELEDLEESTKSDILNSQRRVRKKKKMNFTAEFEEYERSGTPGKVHREAVYSTSWRSQRYPDHESGLPYWLLENEGRSPMPLNHVHHSLSFILRISS